MLLVFAVGFWASVLWIFRIAASVLLADAILFRIAGHSVCSAPHLGILAVFSAPALFLVSLGIRILFLN